MTTNIETTAKERRSGLRKQLMKLNAKRPIEPFRIRLDDGRSFDVRFPNLLLVLNTFLHVGVPEPNEPDPYVERFEYVNLDEIREVELLPQILHTSI